MARSKATKGGVKFTRESALAIAETVRAVQGSSRNQDGSRGSSNAQASSHYLSKTTAAWPKDSAQTLTIYVGAAGSEAASTGTTVQAVNKFGDVASGEWVLLARANGMFYLSAGPAGGGILRGTFTAPWAKGGSASVSVIGAATTYTAKNYFAAVAGSGSKACAIAKVGTEWILIAAEC